MDHPSRCSEPVGGTIKRWLAGEVLELAPQYCRPGGPATANHLIHHDVLNKMSRRLGASGARNRSPRRKKGGDTCRKAGPWDGALGEGNKGNHNPTNQRQGQTSQEHQRPARRATATSRHPRKDNPKRLSLNLLTLGGTAAFKRFAVRVGYFPIGSSSNSAIESTC